MNCGTSLAQGAGARDGSRLIPKEPVATGEAKSTNFQLDRYLPKELVTKLESARSRNEMVGERRVVTMLFCDVKGSTAAAEKVDPEIWSEIMNGVFEFMIRPIYKYEGLVPRLMGDAILAFFGAPITHEDDPQRAVLAGLEIQEGIKAYAEEIRLKYGLAFGLRVGINTGLVVVGEIGSDLRMEYTALGDAINLAARMEQTAQVGTIQISDETYKLVAPFFDVEALGEIEVKGKSAPIKTYRVLGAKSTPGNLRGLEGLSSPLVGRDAQLTALKDRLKDLDRGRGSVVAVVGEAGLGKSTLIAELKKSDEGARFIWLRGDSLSYTSSISYYPWRQIIRQSVEAHENDSPAEVRHKLGYVCECCTLPGGDIPFLEAMLAVESEESAKVVMGFQGDALKQRMIDATRGFMCGLSVESPLVIVFDDLHWTDEASLNLLLNVADLNAEQPILFICMSRPDKTAASWDSIQKMREKLGDAFHSIDLAPLQAEQTETLLNNLLDANELPISLRNLIISKGEGNPFFIEEIIRSLIETKQIIREENHWKAMVDEAKISLPNTLRGVLSARVDRLAETPKHVLQNAAVIGRLFDLRVLRRLTDLSGGLDPQIRYLQDVSLIEALLGEYAFRHVLIQEATYESILLKKRAELHRQIGEALEEIHANRIEEFAPLIAHHFYRAGDDRSLKYDLISGEKSARLYANAEAATHFRRALEVAKRTTADLKQIAHLYTQLGTVLELSGKYQQALANHDEMLSLAIERHERGMELSALMAKATVYSTFTEVHNPELSEKTLIRALEVSQALGDISAQARLNWNLMLTYLFSKRLNQALPYGEAALDLARKSGNTEYLAFVLNDLCRLHTCRGEFEKAHTFVRQARELWISLDHQVMLADSWGSEAEAYFNGGEFELGIECCEKALKISEEINNLWGQAYNMMLMSFVYFENGELGRGIQLAERSVQLADQAGLIASSISLRSELGWAYAYCGAFEKGLSLTIQPLQIADARQPAWRSFPLASRARMYIMKGDLELAGETIGDKPLQPTTIPYARYTIFVCLANLEFAYAKGKYAEVLKLADELMAEVKSLTRVDVPDVLRLKGLALLGLNRLDEALQILTEACSLAKEIDANLQLWSSLAGLADVQSKLGKQKEAEDSLVEARKIVAQVAESLREIGLNESFLNQPQVRKLMR
ncbi:MAG TPA: adenylate/guanylate cyclase domain-containing protein [Anaerolineales bacterium]|nr:adenylate/guanylate cyclase domain-containing protein [Anaerolineales bacterium]